MGKAKNKETRQLVTCYYCGKRVPRSKAVPLYVRPNLMPDVKENEKPLMILTSREKIYVCLSCARFRGISFRDWKRKIGEEERRKKFERLLKSMEKFKI